MKQVSGTIFVTTIVVGIILIAGAFLGGMQTYAMQHGCTLDSTGKATCTK